MALFHQPVPCHSPVAGWYHRCRAVISGVCVGAIVGSDVWQYGHTGKAGRGPGYLSDPDGVDLVPPDSLLVTHGATMGAP